MNFNSNFKNFTKSGFRWGFKQSQPFSFNFRGFFVHNTKKNICFLNNIYMNKSLKISSSILNNVQKKNFVEISNSNKTIKSISFLFNDNTSNDEVSIMSHNLNSDFSKLLVKIMSFNNQILNDGR